MESPEAVEDGVTEWEVSHEVYVGGWIWGGMGMGWLIGWVGGLKWRFCGLDPFVGLAYHYDQPRPLELRFMGTKVKLQMLDLVEIFITNAQQFLDARRRPGGDSGAISYARDQSEHGR